MLAIKAAALRNLDKPDTSSIINSAIDRERNKTHSTDQGIDNELHLRIVRDGVDRVNTVGDHDGSFDVEAMSGSHRVINSVDTKYERCSSGGTISSDEVQVYQVALEFSMTLVLLRCCKIINRPSRSETRGSQPVIVFSRLMSGQRRRGSPVRPDGSGTCSSELRDFVTLMIVRASSLIDVSEALPTFTGPVKDEPMSRIKPPTRSPT